jgi:hypothetical protein
MRTRRRREPWRHKGMRFRKEFRKRRLMLLPNVQIRRNNPQVAEGRPSIKIWIIQSQTWKRTTGSGIGMA